MAYLIELPSFKNELGALTVIEQKLPFEIKRVYYIYDVPKDVIRAGHRHKNNTQALVCIKGECVLYLNNGKKEEEILLSQPNQCLILETEDWHTMHHFSEDSVLLVMASALYDVDDYIDEPYP
ncbi:FdtA/QdtA family cupin domain-containing protein [Deltaproteobacteria bacterium TL4]